jgi:hypothetical protein
MLAAALTDVMGLMIRFMSSLGDCHLHWNAVV